MRKTKSTKYDELAAALRDYCDRYEDAKPNGLERLGKALRCRINEIYGFKSGVRRPNAEKTLLAIEFLTGTSLPIILARGGKVKVTKRERAAIVRDDNDPLHLFNAVLARRAAPAKPTRKTPSTK